uniref:glutathione transferase n=1 Tax=Fagus sylvatica TaxID=28930 RepID=A0A2N9IKH3_FAGSY
MGLGFWGCRGSTVGLPWVWVGLRWVLGFGAAVGLPWVWVGLRWVLGFGAAVGLPWVWGCRGSAVGLPWGCRGNEHIPTPLDATSEPPPLFDGTTRLYISISCPFAQRVWITRNYKGLHDKIKLVPINLQNRPAWYKEKVYPENKVPALEHNGKIIGESLDLIKYVDSNFEGPSLLPHDHAKKEFAEELLAYSDTFTKTVHTSFKGDTLKEAGPAFDHLEKALHKFDDGPFFLGQFSLVDIAFIPFVERFQIVFSAQWNYDITAGRPKLAKWIEEVNKIDAYKVTKTDPKELVELYKARFLPQH